MNVETAPSIDGTPAVRLTPRGLLDGRTRLAKMLELTRENLVAQLGRKPDVLDNEVIDLAAAATVRIRLMQARIVRGETLTADEAEQLLRLHSIASAALGALDLAGKLTIAGLALKHGEA